MSFRLVNFSYEMFNDAMACACAIRNNIMHYSGGTEIYNPDNPNGVTIENGEKAIFTVRITVKYLYDIGSNVKTPDWVDKTQSEIIR